MASGGRCKKSEHKKFPFDVSLYYIVQPTISARATFMYSHGEKC